MTCLIALQLAAANWCATHYTALTRRRFCREWSHMA